MSRKWHVTHANGREWTRRELCVWYGYDPVPIIDIDGRLALLLTHDDGTVAEIVWNPEDMEVAWDG